MVLSGSRGCRAGRRPRNPRGTAYGSSVRAPARLAGVAARAVYRGCMQLRNLGRTGLKVSALGLGTLTWGRDTDEHEARDQLKSFVEAGGTLLDTAAGYGDGASEELIGALLGDVVARDEVVLATKAWVSRARGA